MVKFSKAVYGGLLSLLSSNVVFADADLPVCEIDPNYYDDRICTATGALDSTCFILDERKGHVLLTAHGAYGHKYLSDVHHPADFNFSAQGISFNCSDESYYLHGKDLVLALCDIPENLKFSSKVSLSSSPVELGDLEFLMGNSVTVSDVGEIIRETNHFSSDSFLTHSKFPVVVGDSGNILMDVGGSLSGILIRARSPIGKFKTDKMHYSKGLFVSSSSISDLLSGFENPVGEFSSKMDLAKYLHSRADPKIDYVRKFTIYPRNYSEDIFSGRKINVGNNMLFYLLRDRNDSDDFVVHGFKIPSSTNIISDDFGSKTLLLKDLTYGSLASALSSNFVSDDRANIPVSLYVKKYVVGSIGDGNIAVNLNYSSNFSIENSSSSVYLIKKPLFGLF